MLDLIKGRKAGLLVPVLLAALAACSKQEEAPAPAPQAAPAPASAPAAGTEPAATSPAPVGEGALSPTVASMSVDQLRESATKALRENRMYAPAGDNAVEYYLSLRDKQPDDATVKSALTDLTPYTLIAAEQSINREEFPEAQRLIGLIEKIDAKAPALPRLKTGVTSGMQTAANRTTQEAERAKRDAEQRTQQQAEQKRLAEQQAREAAAAQQIAAQQETARQAAAEAERESAARREAEQRRAAQQAAAAARAAAPTAAAQSLRPISTPAPRYPPEALRAGQSGEVMVEITVGTDGSVTNTRVLRANPPRVFDREAINATKRWKFEPVAAPVTTRRTLSFSPGNG